VIGAKKGLFTHKVIRECNAEELLRNFVYGARGYESDIDLAKVADIKQTRSMEFSRDSTTEKIETISLPVISRLLELSKQSEDDSEIIKNAILILDIYHDSEQTIPLTLGDEVIQKLNP